MKPTLFLAATLALVSTPILVSALPTAEAEPGRWCYWRGEGCGKLKVRAADPLPAADPGRWCFWRGEGCGKKAKRAAAPVALAEAEAEPGRWCFWRGEGCGKKKKMMMMVKRVADPEPGRWCFWRGEGCGKAKREVALPEPVAEADADPETVPETAAAPSSEDDLPPFYFVFDHSNA